ncbi:unnamed protein product [marine sediment metagenome]|uniref:Uncharacterized protein n=1 Tax=marine sediment metagenome TaxID=412755 RepID=X1F4K7_9ZZZZ
MTRQKRYSTVLVRKFQITEEQADVLIEAGLEIVRRARAAEAGVLLALGFSRDEVARIKGI